jgi:hypothetical protein
VRPVTDAARGEPDAVAPMVVLATSLGRIRVRLARSASPNVTRWLEARVAAAANRVNSPWLSRPAGLAPCSGCRFYRAEPTPKGWSEDWFFGPPYALLQGSFGGVARSPFALLEREGGLIVRRGSVIMIDKGPDFLIGLAPHPEWAT